MSWFVPKRECGSSGPKINPFRTALPFWEQIHLESGSISLQNGTAVLKWILSEPYSRFGDKSLRIRVNLAPKRECSSSGSEINPFRTALPPWGQLHLESGSICLQNGNAVLKLILSEPHFRFGDKSLGIRVNLAPKSDCGSIINPFRTALPFWGQMTWN